MYGGHYYNMMNESMENCMDCVHYIISCVTVFHICQLLCKEIQNVDAKMALKMYPFISKTV